MLYGKFPNTTNFSLDKKFSFIFKTSLLINVIFPVYCSLSKSNNLVSFSIKKIFGFLIISFVRLPVPGQISKIFYFQFLYNS